MEKLLILIFNISLRILTLIGKFILLFVLAKYLSMEELGIFGLFTTTITLSTLLIGLDFYNFSIREIVTNRDRIADYIFNQFIFHSFLYIVIFPILFIIIFYSGFIPSKYLIWFYSILIFEHISQEMFRLFTVLKKSFLANFILFVRSGIWIYVLLLIWFIRNFSISLDIIWKFWFLGSLLSVLISISYLKKEGYIKKPKLDFLFIKRGVKTGLFFFIGTISYKIIEYSDRYMIDIFISKSAVGIYTFYSNIANVLNTIVFVSVIMIYYPRLMEYVKYVDAFKKLSRKFLIYTFTVSMFVGVILIIGIYFILYLIEKRELFQYIPVFYLLVLANIILNLSFIPHYILYSMKRDKIIIYSSVIGALINIMLNLYLIKILGLIGCALSTFISYSTIALIKLSYIKERSL